jgi:hypothetical protein
MLLVKRIEEAPPEVARLVLLDGAGSGDALRIAFRRPLSQEEEGEVSPYVQLHVDTRAFLEEHEVVSGEIDESLGDAGGRGRALSLTRDFFRILAGDLRYGFASVTRSADTISGTMWEAETYGTPSAVPWERWVEAMAWHQVGATSGVARARGVFWANYFGREMIERFAGGLDGFRERFDARGLADATLESLGNGALFLVTENCMDTSCNYPSHGIQPGEGLRNGVFLFKEMRRAGML